MNKKGFTLVELLAVIVILAIILAIAVPSITSLIDAQRKSAFESNVKMLIRGIDYRKMELDSVNGKFVKDGDDGEYTLDADIKAQVDDFGGNVEDYESFKIISISPVKVTIITKSNSKFGSLCVTEATSSSINVQTPVDDACPANQP